MAVTKHFLLILLAFFCAQQASVLAAVLPQDRADAMYHSYSGDGISIDGPSILLRKKVSNSLSLSANYYVDSISGASIDVRATASAYDEERTETTVGMDYLHNKTLLNLSYTNSSENDFEANSVHFGISQDFFGDLTTLSLNYSRGEDDVGRTGDDTFAETASRQKFAVGVSQVMSKKLIMGFNAENISDEGFLNNPYRSIRFLDANSARGFRFAPEMYPNTRTSNAYSINANYYLEYRASIYAEARIYSDTWGIDGNNVKLGYIHTFGDAWILDFHVRYYQQDKADFYQDLFSREDEFNFMARDKELSTFDSLSAGLAVSYEWQFSQQSWLQKSSVHFEYDYLSFDYDDFRNVLDDAAVGEEELFSFSANVVRLYLSVFY